MLKLILDIALFSGIWFFAIYTFSLSHMERLAFRKKTSHFEKYLTIGSKIIIGIVMVLQILILFNRHWFVSRVLESALQTPPNTHIIYVSGAVVLFFSAIDMTMKALESERYLLKNQKKAIVWINGMLVLSAIVIVTFFQSLFWGQMRGMYSNTGVFNHSMELFVDGIMILAPGLLLLSNTVRYIKKERIRVLGLRISMPIILFVGFTQMIFAQIAVLYEVAVWFYEKFMVKSQNEKTMKGDKLLIATSLTFGRPLAKMNAYFLTSYFVVMLMVWTLQGNPFYLGNPLYMDGYRMAFFLTCAIMTFWFIEAVARQATRLIHHGAWIRLAFIPILLTLTIYPFYTSFAGLNTVLVPDQSASIYHVMASALGQNKYIFFLCLVIIQSIMAYILHIVTGEAHNDRHYYSVLPITVVVQVFILAIIYPVFLSLPPYALLTNRVWILILIFLIGLFVTVGMATIALKLFTEKTSDWASYVSRYWKDKTRVYVIVGLITIFTFMPIFSIAMHPISNKGLTFDWEEEFFETESSFRVQSIFNTQSKEEAYMLASDETSISRLICFNISDGSVRWEKVFGSYFDQFKVWDDDTVVLSKANKTGFSVINLSNGSMQYDYTVKDPETLEFLNIEINDRAVLVTVNTEQFVFDNIIGQMQLDTMGNNFYHLIPGNYCALTKNSKVYVYQNERWEKVSGIIGVEEAQLIYYDEDGMLVFGEDEIVKYNAQLTQQMEGAYPKSTLEPVEMNQSLYSKVGEEVTFYMAEGTKTFAYVFNVETFTYQVIALEQKIQGNDDTQSIKQLDEVGQYILMDEYQFTLMHNENLVARQWYQIPLTPKGIVSYQGDVQGEPVVIDKRILWAENDGTIHSVIIP